MPTRLTRRWLLIRRTQLVALVTVCTGAVMALGVALVLYLARLSQDAILSQVDMATSLVSSLQSSIGIMEAAAETIRLMPSPELQNATEGALYQHLLLLSPISAALSVEIIPGAHVLLNDRPGRQQVLQTNMTVINFLEPSIFVPRSVRDLIVYGINNKMVTLPDATVPSSLPVAHNILRPVYVKALSPNETWGWPEYRVATECMTGLADGGGILNCYDRLKGIKWWGHVVMIIQCTRLPDVLGGEVLRSSDVAYQLSLIQDASDFGAAVLEPVVLYNSGNRTQCQSPLRTSVTPLTHGLSAQVDVCITNGYAVPWKAPVLVCVVMLPVLAGVGFLFIMVNWMRHSDVLHSLLAPTTINKLVKQRLSGENSIHEAPGLSGSPSEKLISMLGMLLSGTMPSHDDVMEMVVALQQGIDLDVPLDLMQRIRQTLGPEGGEVTEALTRVLVYSTSTALAGASGSHPGTHPSQAQQLPSVADLEMDEGHSDDLMRVLQCITGLRVDGNDTSSLRLSFETDMLASHFLFKSASSMPGLRKCSFSEVYHTDALGTTDTFSIFTPVVDPGHSPMGNLERLLANTMSLDGSFDAWELQAESQNHPLSSLAYYCFHESGLIKNMALSARHLAKFLLVIESGYRNNPYHNRTHAADVLQSVHAFLCTAGVKQKHLDSMDVMACYLAAAIHDYNHTGLTNDFLITTSNELALRYNDISVQENHHVSAGLSLMMQPEYDFLQHWTKADKTRLRRLVIDLVLATDMKKHFAIVSSMNNHRQLMLITDQAEGSGMVKSMSSERPARGMSGPASATIMARSHANTSYSGAVADNPKGSCGAPTQLGRAGASPAASGMQSASSPSNVVTHQAQPLSEMDKLLAMQVMLKCADLGHTCATLHVHLLWVKALQEEFFLQGDKEKVASLPFSPLCNRQGVGVSQSQVGFFDIVVLPLLKAFTSMYPGALPVLNTAKANHLYWKASQCAEPSNG